MIWLLYESTQSWIGKCLGVGGFPESWNWSGTSLHSVLKGLILSTLDEALREHSLKGSVYYWHTGKAKLKYDVTIVLNKVLDSQENSIESILYYILSEKASSCNWNWIAINHSESLLEDRVLRFSRGNLFLSVISV